MGNTRKPKKQYDRPFKIWNRERLDIEKPMVKEFGLHNKMELWRVSSLLRKYTSQAKKLNASRSKQSDIEAKQLISKLSLLGIVSREASLDDVLGLGVKDFLERRLQTVVFKKKLSRSVMQSRQFITHKHVSIGGKIITSPSYMVSLVDEPSVSFVSSSSLASEEHPERSVKEKPVEVPDAKE